MYELINGPKIGFKQFISVIDYRKLSADHKKFYRLRENKTTDYDIIEEDFLPD